MIKKLIQNLLLTFIFSLLLTGLFYLIWFNARPRGFEEGQAMTLLLFAGDIFLNLVLTIFALPSLLLTNIENYIDKKKRLVYYFGGPILATLIFIVFIYNDWNNTFSFLLASGSFLAVHSYFYFQLTRDTNEKDN